MRQQAGSLLKEYVEQQKEGPMEFFAALLVNGSNASHGTVLQAVQLYKEIISMESTSSAQQCVACKKKAELLDDAEINAMASVVAMLEEGAADIPQDRELARQLRRRCGMLKEK